MRLVLVLLLLAFLVLGLYVGWQLWGRPAKAAPLKDEIVIQDAAQTRILCAGCITRPRCTQSGCLHEYLLKQVEGMEGPHTITHL